MGFVSFFKFRAVSHNVTNFIGLFKLSSDSLKTVFFFFLVFKCFLLFLLAFLSIHIRESSHYSADIIYFPKEFCEELEKVRTGLR